MCLIIFLLVFTLHSHSLFSAEAPPMQKGHRNLQGDFNNDGRLDEKERLMLRKLKESQKNLKDKKRQTIKNKNSIKKIETNNQLNKELPKKSLPKPDRISNKSRLPVETIKKAEINLVKPKISNPIEKLFDKDKDGYLNPEEEKIMCAELNSMIKERQKKIKDTTKIDEPIKRESINMTKEGKLEIKTKKGEIP